MPRKKIDLPYHVNYLSILDKDGNVDQDLDPGLPEDLMLRLHRAMLLARRFDERMLVLQRQGRIGTFGPIKGQEASQIGAIAVLEPEDWLVPAFREMGAEMVKAILKRLKVDNKTIDRVSEIVKHHLRPLLLGPNPSSKALRRFIRKVGDDMVDAVLDMAHADLKGREPSKSHVPELREKIKDIRTSPLKPKEKAD